MNTSDHAAIHIRCGYPDPSINPGEDSRFDLRILQVLERAGWNSEGGIYLDLLAITGKFKLRGRKVIPRVDKIGRCPDLEMQVCPAGVSRRADCADALALAHALPAEAV